MASKALEDYKQKRAVPNLPVNFSDEAGLLMGNIQDTIKNVENLLQQKQELIFLLSHDLRNYVGKPSALAKLILEENPSVRIKEYSGMIIETTEKQSDFLEGFITLLDREEEIVKKTIRIKSINLKEIMSAVRSQLSDKLEAKNIKLNFDAQVNEVYLKIEPDMLTQVLVNLTENAIKFSHIGSDIDIRISKDRAQLDIAVADKGIGFENIDSRELFQKFTKYGRPGTANEKSIGIGLYLCNQIIKKSEGILYGESAGKDKGATFHVNLKVYKKH
jgi:K+-sensing histidine kinase KdpD